VYFEKNDLKLWRRVCCGKKANVTVGSVGSSSGGSGKKKKPANATSPVLAPAPPSPKPK